MRKFLGVSLAVGALMIVSGVAVAHLDHGSGHDMHGAKGHAMKAGHHEMMTNHMSKAGHGMKTQMSKAGHEMMKNHLGKTGHDMKSHAGKAGHEMKNHGEAGHE
jgi:hypothetical protein